MSESRIDLELTEAQTDIMRYWSSLNRADGLPRRKAFDPGAVLKHLRYISILELTERGRIECRILGSSHSRFDRHEQIDIVQAMGVDAVLNEQVPVSGHRRLANGTHHWLRLPLLSDCGRNLLILCHDEVARERFTSRPERTLSGDYPASYRALAA